ncbi:PAS domain-containing hybrid sensor histidine kinase/response regulator [Fundidesulfovibrio agrisoli]|uniref:PAS domain-containing hybrid sensor histidine kinase/response regulator n=1 Tax=Fundidesulfovibrio agrisoli TaxID=2922717 RepID=UPI001FAC0CE1|nr:PAS domain-containing hybrid sensor histidine kinase/response regulator [Fundidesulfovibrio agrisoli]
MGLKDRCPSCNSVCPSTGDLCCEALFSGQLLYLEDFPTPVWRTDASGRLDYCNRTWKEFTGRVLGEELAAGPLANIHPDDRAIYQEAFERALARREPLEAQYRLNCRGQWRWVADRGRPYHDAQGRFAGFIGSCFDITGSIRQEVELRRANAASQAAIKAKAEFLANISHEIRTPLNGIMGMLSALEDTPITKEQAELLSIAGYSARQLLGVLNDVLDAARIEAGNLHLHEAPLHLGELLRMGMGVYEVEAANLELRLETSIGEELENELVLLDEVRVRQLLFNLTGNAVKFTRPGGTVSITAWLAGAKNKRRLVFMVSDTGIGIPQDKLPQIFEPFVQADGGLTRQYGGVGLGLSIVCKLVAAMGGSLCVSSEPGEGADFVVSIPVRTTPLKKAPSREQRHPAPALSPMKALLAEDDTIGRITGTRMLEKMGMEVTCALNGHQAVEMFRSGSYDIVFMDVQMPVMDGLAATRAMRELEAVSSSKGRTPIVAMTAHAMDGDKDICLQAGMDGYVAKPLDKDKLAEAVKLALSGREQ